MTPEADVSWRRIGHVDSDGPPAGRAIRVVIDNAPPIAGYTPATAVCVLSWIEGVDRWRIERVLVSARVGEPPANWTFTYPSDGYELDYVWPGDMPVWLALHVMNLTEIARPEDAECPPKHPSRP